MAVSLFALSSNLVPIEVIDAAAGALRVIERHIGTLQQLLCVSSILRRNGNADRHSDRNLMTVNVVGRADFLDEPFRQSRRLQVGLPGDLQHDKLVAPHPGYRIGSPHAAPQPFGHGA